VLRDRDNRIFADPDKIHRVRHFGRHYQVDAIHLAEPSPQRTPVLYQAGSSARGREFAATHAECVFVNGPDKTITRSLVGDIRRRAVAHGRTPDDILVFLGRTVVVGETHKQAIEKYQEYHRHASIEGALAHFSSSIGVDLSRYELDEPIRHERNNANNSAIEAITSLSTEPWTLRRLIGQMGLGSRNAPIVGSAYEVADELIAWVEETGIDGFNLSRIVTPESLEDFVDLVVPLLQDRGVYKRDYAQGTLREKLFGDARLPETHPAASHRWRTEHLRQTAAE
jgi:FMN-dependent oxidoreductase (nitrilotriacetate monooxygenase family)